MGATTPSCLLPLVVSSGANEGDRGNGMVGFPLTNPEVEEVEGRRITVSSGIRRIREDTAQAGAAADVHRRYPGGIRGCRSPADAAASET